MIASGATRLCARSNNEDAYRLAEPGEAPPLYLVADGMGGAAGGEVASQLAVEVCARRFGLHAASQNRSRPADWGGILRAAWSEANRQVFEAAERRPSLRGMGTTLTGFCLVPSVVEVEARSNHTMYCTDLWVAHVGDSRCYGLGRGELQRLTDDHTWSGARNMLLRAVGTARSVAVDVARVRAVEAGDAFLLCSDGVTGALDDDAIRRILLAGADADGVVDEAERAGAADNCTAVVVRV